MSSDTVAGIGDDIDAEVAVLKAEADDFVNLLRDDAEVDFSVVGDPDTLNYLQWDYTADMAFLNTIRPGYILNVGGAAQAAADRLRALATPVEPTLSLPTANIPTLDAERPVVSLPALPGTDVGTAPSDSPQITEAALPDAPLVALPTVPTFAELDLPVVPTFSLPTISSQMPSNTLAAPTTQFSFVDEEYTSSLRDPLVAKLLYDLQNGGYGIEATDEQALWTRARDRAEAEGRLAVESAIKRAAATSFPLPQGAYFADLQRERAAVLRALSEANRDIALKRSELYVENRKFTIQQVQEYEKVAINLYNAVQERALNAARAVVELGIAVYDATVRNYNAQLEAFRTENQVFEIRIRAELAKAELYRSQIEAERLRGEFNKQRVDLYQAQLNGIQSVVNLYKTRVEAVNALTAVQAQKVDIFKARVQAYATRVQAKASEYDMYRAATQGELAKVEIYKADLQGYETKVRAEESRTKVLLQANEALLQKFKSEVDRFNVQLTAAVKDVDSRSDVDRNVILAQGVNNQVYRAYTDAVIEAVRVRQNTQKLNNDWNIAALNSRVNVVNVRLDQLKATMSNRATIDQFGAKFYGDQLATLRNAVNALSVKSE